MNIVALYISPGHNYFGRHGLPAEKNPVVAVPAVECLAGRGLAGDRFAKLKTDQIEARIEQIETRIRELDEAMADPDVWRNHSRMEELGAERKKLLAEKEPLEFEWSRRAEG